MARVVKTKKIKKKRIKETEKNLRKQLRGSGLSRKEARKQAGATAEDVYEAGRQKTLAENAAKRAENQAKREAYFKKGEESQAKLKQSKSDPSKNSGGSGLPSAEEVKRKQEEMKQFREESKRKDETTARGKANISAARQAKPGEAYTRINPDGTTKKVVKIDPSKKNKGKVTEKPVAKTVKTSNQDKLSKTSTPSKTPTKTKSELAAKPSAKTKPSSYSTSGAVKSDATMKNVASKKTDPVKSGSAGSGSVNRGPSIMDRIKTKLQEGDEAVRNLPGTISEGVSRARKYFGFEHGGRINKLKKKAKHGGALAIMIAPVKTKKMKAVKKGAHGAKVKEAMYGAKMKKAEMGAKLKEVPSDNKGLGKLPKKVRNKMGYMKNGGKVTDTKKQTARDKARFIKNINDEFNQPKKKIKISTPEIEKMKKEYSSLMDKASRSNFTKEQQEVFKSRGITLDKKIQKKIKATPEYKEMIKKRRGAMYGGAIKKAMYGAKMKKMENGGKVKKRTTTVTENTPSRFSKFTDTQKAQLKDRAKRLKGEDKKDFDYDVAKSKDTKSKTTTTTKRRSGKVKSQSVTEKRKSSIPGRSTDVTTTSKKRRGGSTRVKITSYGAGDDRDAGRVVKQKYSRKGKLKKTKVISKGQSKVKPKKGTFVSKGQPDEYEYKK